MERGLVFLLLAALLAVLLWAWPWLERETIMPVVDISGYVLKSWSPLIMILLLLLALYQIIRHTFFR
ncbi:MAG TPA: hypothetical protein PKM88_02730 [bacterium]|nr:hypothetical protein [bacterium]